MSVGGWQSKQGGARSSALIAVVALAIAAAPASAPATTFSGSCDMRGALVPREPYRWVPELNNDAELNAEGTCTGTLDGAPYDGPASTYVDVRMNIPMSCGVVIARNVPGVITFGDDADAVDATRLDIVYAEALQLFGQLPVHFTGAYNGHGLAWASLDAGEKEIRACADEEGLKATPLSLRYDTLQPVYG